MPSKFEAIVRFSRFAQLTPQFTKFDEGNKGGLTWREFAQCVRRRCLTDLAA